MLVTAAATEVEVVVIHLLVNEALEAVEPADILVPAAKAVEATDLL